MAKKKDDAPPPVEDVTPVGGESDGPTPDAETPSADPKDQEIAALRAMLAERDAALESAKASGVAAYPAGRKYRVALTGGCTAVIEVREGEHPFEAYKRLTGVINSVHTPEISPAPADSVCGVISRNGKVRPFPA